MPQLGKYYPVNRETNKNTRLNLRKITFVIVENRANHNISTALQRHDQKRTSSPIIRVYSRTGACKLRKSIWILDISSKEKIFHNCGCLFLPPVERTVLYRWFVWGFLIISADYRYVLRKCKVNRQINLERMWNEMLLGLRNTGRIREGVNTQPYTRGHGF